MDGGTEGDVLYGGNGNDTLIGATGDDYLAGEAGYDILQGGAGADYLRGDDGNDQLDGGSENDTLWGGSGNDKLTGGGGNDELRGEGGANQLDGGSGTDLLDIDLSAESVGVRFDGTVSNHLSVLADGSPLPDGAAAENGEQFWVGGSNYKDVLIGGALHDRLFGNDGNDSISGRGGEDVIVGASGNDTLNGGAGEDWLYGDDGDDSLNGGVELDFLYGGSGNDRLKGEAGYDRLFGDDGNDTLDGGDDVDYLYGGNGDDKLIGGNSYDELRGEDGNDLMDGGTDNDSLWAGAGNDTLTGGENNDNLDGEDGNDRLDGNTGDDSLRGGGGDDTFVLSPGNDTIQDFQPNAAHGDVLLNFYDTLGYLYGYKGLTWSGASAVDASTWGGYETVLTSGTNVCSGDPYGGSFSSPGADFDLASGNFASYNNDSGYASWWLYAVDDGNQMGWVQLDLIGGQKATVDFLHRVVDGANASFGGSFESIDTVYWQTGYNYEPLPMDDLLLTNFEASGIDKIDLPANLSVDEFIASRQSDGNGGTILYHDQGTLSLPGIDTSAVSADWFV